MLRVDKKGSQMLFNERLAPGELAWHVAANCDGGSCIQVAAAGELIVLGDSKSPEGPLLSYSRDEWETFVTAIKHGEFDCVLRS